MKKSNHVRSHPVSRTESCMQVKPTFFLAATLIIAVYVFLTPIPAFATNDALDSSADTNIVADDGAQLETSNGVGVTVAPTSVTNLGHQGVVTTVILLIIGVELTALLIMLPMMMEANKRETLAGLKRIDAYLSTPRANGCTHCVNQESATDTHTPTPPTQQNFVAEEVGEPGNCVAPQPTNHEQP